MANGTGDGGKESNSGTVGGSVVVGSGVGASIAAYINYYGSIPDVLHTDTIVLCVAGLGAITGLLAHLMTRVDKDKDGIPDALQRQVNQNAAAIQTMKEEKS